MTRMDADCLERTLRAIVRMFIQGRLAYREATPRLFSAGVGERAAHLRWVRRAAALGFIGSGARGASSSVPADTMPAEDPEVPDIECLAPAPVERDLPIVVAVQ